uniref:Gliotoxin biosynthesis protein n=1 Tax=Colletotrichum fructicola (strain Nara gc5) TaxID=1213859 RepID=L2FTQ8_COLFN
MGKETSSQPPTSLSTIIPSRTEPSIIPASPSPQPNKYPSKRPSRTSIHLIISSTRAPAPIATRRRVPIAKDGILTTLRLPRPPSPPPRSDLLQTEAHLPSHLKHPAHIPRPPRRRLLRIFLCLRRSEKPPIDIPKPFFAHTLYSPAIPDAPDDDKNPKDGDDGDDPRKKWHYHLITPPRRPDPTYAQPSARYLKLITDGAAEHELPDDYQAWLATLQPYTVTSCRQQLAQWLLTGIFFPVMLLFFQLNKWVANKEGKVPLWLGVSLSVVFNMLWMGYDAVLKPVFGDGERTEEEEKKRWRGAPASDVEKMNLLMRDW